MKFSYSLLSLMLLTSGAAWAQESTPISTTVTETDSTIRTVEVYKISPEKNPMLTPADSARERARKENARRLRQTGKNNPAHGPTLPAAPQAQPPATVTETTTTPDAKTLERDTKRREEAARKAAEADKKRDKTLYKRAKKSS